MPDLQYSDIANKISELWKKIEEICRVFDVEKKKGELASREKKAASSNFWNDSMHARKEMKKINDLKRDIESIEKIKSEIEDARTHLDLAEEMKDRKEATLVMNNLSKTAKKIDDLGAQIKLSEPSDKCDAILSIHAGAGGTEACDWAQMLQRMYTRWAQNKNYSFVITDILPGEEAGIKSVTAFVRGEYAYGYLKSEIGVHRLVRISPFDANKRRHTSFASVDVLADIEEDIEIKIEDKDIRVDTYRSGGKGGQNVNKLETAVRITHLPSGVVAQCQSERSQHQNKENAMKMLKAKLYEIEMDKKRSAMERHYDEKGDIGWGYQIRSYVFMPYQLVKDLRTGYETSNVEGVMDGDLDPFIHSYLNWRATLRK